MITIVPPNILPAKHAPCECLGITVISGILITSIMSVLLVISIISVSLVISVVSVLLVIGKVSDAACSDCQ